MMTMVLRQRGLATGPAAIQTQDESMKNATDSETKHGIAAAYDIDEMGIVWRRTSGDDRQEGNTRLYGGNRGTELRNGDDTSMHEASSSSLKSKEKK